MPTWENVTHLPVFLCLQSSENTPMIMFCPQQYGQRTDPSLPIISIDILQFAVRGKRHGGADREHNGPLPHPLRHRGHLPSQQVLQGPEAWRCLKIEFQTGTLRTSEYIQYQINYPMQTVFQ